MLNCFQDFFFIVHDKNGTLRHGCHPRFSFFGSGALFESLIDHFDGIFSEMHCTAWRMHRCRHCGDLLLDQDLWFY